MTTPSPQTALHPDQVTPQLLREVLGQFVSGIVVITSVGPDGPVGFTCQSFASLSLDPPLISFSPARSSSTWPRIREIGTFCVNVLAEDHEHHSAGFARSGVDKFAGVDWDQAPSGAPVLPGVSAWIDCELWAEYDGGDHTIVTGRVNALGADPENLPLLFYRGGYTFTAPSGPAGQKWT
ncbi:flavin reductase family protein [Rhodococcus sp. NPDC057014]|uniref:flavin reductase family protein n=1 Tax=Rhodococcus sp. NPDC057014 TaxID=3346000 RepID=UPI0036303A5E